MRALIGFVFLGGAVLVSRRVHGGLGDLIPQDESGEALASLEAAAHGMFPKVNLDPRRTLLYSDENYQPNCDFLAQKVAEATRDAQEARANGRWAAEPLWIAVEQYAALADLSCPGWKAPT